LRAQIDAYVAFTYSTAMNLTLKNALVILTVGAIGCLVGFIVSLFLHPGQMPEVEKAIGLRWGCVLFGAVAGFGMGVILSIVKGARDPNAAPSYNWTTINGMGSMLIGKADCREDGSYCTTEWFVVFFLPILPVSRYRVIKHGGGIAYSSYTILEKQPPRAADAARVYVFVYAFIVVTIAVALYLMYR
jgi:hypothetical protein